MEDQGTTPATGASPAAGDTSQVQQIRQTIAKQVAELKQQISLIQQQSLKTMQETIDSVFSKQVSDNLQQVSRQEQQSLQQLQASPAAATAAPQPASPYSDIPTGTDAMAAANQSVEQAMQAANQSLENAEKLLSGLGQHPQPGSGSGS